MRGALARMDLQPCPVHSCLCPAAAAHSLSLGNICRPRICCVAKDAPVLVCIVFTCFIIPANNNSLCLCCAHAQRLIR